jgi:hypothetical protein
MSGFGKRGAATFSDISVQGELRDHEDAPAVLGQARVDGPARVWKKAQAQEFVHEFRPQGAMNHAGLIAAPEADEHHQTRSDLACHAALNGDGCPPHPLQDRAHQAGPSE